MLPDVLKHSKVEVTFGAGTLRELGRLAAQRGAMHVFLVTDPGIVKAGHAARAASALAAANVEVTLFDGVAENPTTLHVAAGVDVARACKADLIVGLGGGSSMDCAKGVNFILTNGGQMKDYWGIGKATKPMLPMIAIPTTAGTGSEAQSFALITDPQSHQKMACGDSKALPGAAILDPELTRTMPRAVAAATGIDAVAHAVETAATKRRNDVSRDLSRAAWRLMSDAYSKAVNQPEDAEARTAMLFGAHLAGAAIEKSMLGAAHACANPLTAKFGIVHGIAVGVMLPHVVRFNSEQENPYADLTEDAKQLASRIETMLEEAGLPRRLRDISVNESGIAEMAEMAAAQWTAEFNPRALAPTDAAALYRAAW